MGSTSKKLKSSSQPTKTQTRRRRSNDLQRRASRKVSRACTCSKDEDVSGKLEALKNLIPAAAGACRFEENQNVRDKADQLFQETADYILLLRTQVAGLKTLIHLYGSSATAHDDQLHQNQHAA